MLQTLSQNAFLKTQLRVEQFSRWNWWHVLTSSTKFDCNECIPRVYNEKSSEGYIYVFWLRHLCKLKIFSFYNYVQIHFNKNAEKLVLNKILGLQIQREKPVRKRVLKSLCWDIAKHEIKVALMIHFWICNKSSEQTVHIDTLQNDFGHGSTIKASDLLL